jgi:two-component system, OmpR family, KDP operon response regulator KdpE
MKILMIDDDASVREALTISLQLQLQDVEVLQAADGESGLQMFFDTNPDIVLLDINMARMSGFEILREIRRVSDVPVLMLTARDEEMDQVRGLELGVDVYLRKPLRHATLVASIKNVLRRSERVAPVQVMPDFTAGALTIHFQKEQVTLAGVPVKLTPIEYRLLYQLVRNAGHVLPHEAFLDRVWGGNHEVGAEHLKVFISRLRAKLRRPGSPEYIQTERGIGYRFVKDQDSRPDPPLDPQTIGSETPQSLWLAIDSIDATPETRNARRHHSQTRLRDLAESIREHGVLEPILVIPVGDRYEVVAGNRRLEAARMAGLDRIPAIVRADSDERSRLLINLVENVQRSDLRPIERIGAVRQLAAGGLGVREIARGTGFSPATISRWIRIAGNTRLSQALEDGRIDLFRAMYLAGISDDDLLVELIDLAPRYSADDFYALVQQRTAHHHQADVSVIRQLIAIADRLARLQPTAEAEQPLQRIVEIATVQLQQIHTSDEGSPP